MSLASRDKLIYALETALGIPFDRAFELAEFLDNYIIDEVNAGLADHESDHHDGSDNA